MLSTDKLAKYGHFDELCRRAAAGEPVNLVQIFERAVTDFRSVRRTPGHQRILLWCLDQGIDFGARAGWLNQPLACLAAAATDTDILEAMTRRGLPEDPFVRASVGDVEFLQHCGWRKLSEMHDRNGFNLLFYCAASGLGRVNQARKERLTQIAKLLIDHGVDVAHEVQAELPIFPAFLCATTGGHEEIMALLLAHGGLPVNRSHQVLEHTLEPHQRSGEPFYRIAEMILRHGLNINSLSPHQGRTLLHGSANRGAVQAVTWLLRQGADPNAMDDRGRTPLHVCAERNTSTSVASLLIGAGSDPQVRDATGKTPLDYARASGRARVVEYLAAAGG